METRNIKGCSVAKRRLDPNWNEDIYIELKKVLAQRRIKSSYLKMRTGCRLPRQLTTMQMVATLDWLYTTKVDYRYFETLKLKT